MAGGAVHQVRRGFRLSSRRNELKGYENPPDWFFWNAWLG